MADKFIVPARRKIKDSSNGCVVRVPREAYNALVDMYNESTLSMTKLAGMAIMYAAKNVVYEKQD